MNLHWFWFFIAGMAITAANFFHLGWRVGRCRSKPEKKQDICRARMAHEQWIEFESSLNEFHASGKRLQLYLRQEYEDDEKLCALYKDTLGKAVMAIRMTQAAWEQDHMRLAGLGRQ